MKPVISASCDDVEGSAPDLAPTLRMDEHPTRRVRALIPDPDAERPLFQVMVQSVLHGARSGLYGGSVMAATIAWMFWDESERLGFMAWFGTLALSMVLRGHLLRAWSDPSIRLERHHVRALTAIYVAVGIIWGLAGWVFNHAGPGRWEEFALLTCQYLLVVSSAVALSGYLPVYAAFSTALCLLIPVPWMHGGDREGIIVGIGTAATFLSGLGFALHHARIQAESITMRFTLVQTDARIREIERARILSEERQRLMQDMHDGLGSSLVSALRAMERGELERGNAARMIRGCLDDLKLVIDSMESVDADLLLLLATLRTRLGPRLKAGGIALRWEVTDVPALPWLDGRNALHILRILQEAFTNILQHADATEIRVATWVAEGRVAVVIADNGRGFSRNDVGRASGKGLANQARRAESIGAAITWAPGNPGTCVTLELPIQGEPSEA